MNIIRGAITVDADTAEEIREKTAELMGAIVRENGLSGKEIRGVIFSTTQDIHSYYPAKAARECGFESCALFSAAEPDIAGALPLCIRAFVLAEGLSAPERHVYLGKAASLRRDISRKLTIAIDGPAGSGKSTLARALASAYGILYLDTGAMYRACALKLIRDGVPADDAEAVSGAVLGADVSVRYEGGCQHTYLDGEDVSDAIRRSDVTLVSSRIAQYPAVREKMVKVQRAIAASQSCVMDGRDIGTAVLPDAPFKFYVTASADVRAKRRCDEMRARGADADLATVRRDLLERDRQDETREISPLRRADDAVLLDTSDMTPEETLGFLRRKIQERV